MKSPNLLVLFTDAYPFDLREPHLADEVDYLFSAFEKVIIFSTFSGEYFQAQLPSHVTAYKVPLVLGINYKIISLKYLFSKAFYHEFSFYKKNLKAPSVIRKTKIFLAEISKAFILYKAVKKKLNNNIPDNTTIYFYSFWNNYKAIAATFLKKEYPFSKTFSRAHGWDVYFERHPENYLPGKSILFKKLDAIFHVSENGLNYNADRFGFSQNMKISRMGSTNNAMPVFNKLREPFHIVSCSNIIPLKRVDLIIKALAQVNEKLVIKWTHIGHGELQESLKILANELLSEKKNISFHFIGYIIKKEVKEFLLNENVNLFINVSSTEGLPVSIMEAMSFAIPVIATDVGGTSEILENGKNGTLLNANPPAQEIASNIEKYVLMDESLYINQCKAAYKTWNEKYNAEKNYPAFIEEIFKL